MDRMANFTKHGQYLYQLKHLGMLNTYILQEDDGLTLIDTGIASSATRIIQAIDTMQQPLKRIVLTHAHTDHVGGLDALHAHYPDAEVMISRRDAKWLAGDASLESDEPAIPLRKQQVNVATKPTRLLEAGESVGSLQVHSASGHTPGQLAFLDSRDGTLIAGDAFVTLFGYGRVAVAGATGWARWRFPLPHRATWSAELSFRYAKELTALEPKRLAVGHGRVIENPVAAMHAACSQG